MSMESMVAKIALKEFQKQLNNPDSDIAKRFHTMLYGEEGDGSGGLFGRMTSGELFNSDNKGNNTSDDDNDNGNGRSNNVTQRSDEEIAEQMQHYKRTPAQAIIDNALPTVGKLSKGAGNIANTYDSLLGDALIAVSQGLASQGYDNPFAMSPAVAAGRKARGTMWQTIGNTADSILEGIATDIKTNREKEREAELLLRERPSGQFYIARSRLDNQNQADK